MKSWMSNAFATAVAVAAGAVTIAVSLKYLKEPDAPLWQALTDPRHHWDAVSDWSVLILSGLTTATIAFFVVWGHFQKEPKPDSAGSTTLE